MVGRQVLMSDWWVNPDATINEPCDLSHFTLGRINYIICRVQCRVQRSGPLFKICWELYDGNQRMLNLSKFEELTLLSLKGAMIMVQLEGSVWTLSYALGCLGFHFLCKGHMYPLGEQGLLCMHTTCACSRDSCLPRAWVGFQGRKTLLCRTGWGSVEIRAVFDACVYDWGWNSGLHVC
jgi:hypothetical protein